MQGNMFAIGLLAVAILVFVVIVNILDNRGLNRIKSKKVGDGQHGTARWASHSSLRLGEQGKTDRLFRELSLPAEAVSIPQLLLTQAMSIR